MSRKPNFAPGWDDLHKKYGSIIALGLAMRASGSEVSCWGHNRSIPRYRKLARIIQVFKDNGIEPPRLYLDLLSYKIK